MSVDFFFRELSGQTTVEWTIRDFSSLPKTRQFLLTSPPVLVGDMQLFIRMYPNETHHVLIGLGRKKSPLSTIHNVAYDFKFYDGEELVSTTAKQKYDFSTDTSPMTLVYKYGTVRWSGFVRPGIDLRIRCSISLDGSGLEAVNDSEVGQARRMNKSTETLLENLKGLFLTGSNSDVTIKVDARDFQAHRAVLAARSPVFSSMFEHDMLEKTSGTINVPDCEPEAFRGFLQYLYTGQVGDVTPEDLPGVYIMGVKYDVPELRGECIELLRHRMTVNAFCESLVIASVYEEEELMCIVEKFFFHNFQQIFRCGMWKSLLVDHPDLANQLFQKVAEKNED